MTQITVDANEIPQFFLQTFGNKLCGMFKNTSLLSSDDFVKNI